MRRVLTTVAMVGVACSGGGNDQADTAVTSASEVPLSTVSATPATSDGADHTVDMVLTAQGEYKFVPEALTIKTGDNVKWINVSGGPHNVKFAADGIPDGAAEVLSAAMEGRMMTALEGMLLLAPNAEYEISFAGAPAGEYAITCTPHTPLGMNSTLTVEN